MQWICTLCKRSARGRRGNYDWRSEEACWGHSARRLWNWAASPSPPHRVPPPPLGRGDADQLYEGQAASKKGILSRPIVKKMQLSCALKYLVVKLPDCVCTLPSSDSERGSEQI